MTNGQSFYKKTNILYKYSNDSKARSRLNEDALLTSTPLDPLVNP